MHTPLITIAIPTLNRRAYLAQALASALAQTYPHIEVVVSDNDSEDDTASFLAEIKDARLKLLRQSTRLSMMENWNACLRAASGEFFILLSDDDWLAPRAIELMIQHFLSGSGEVPVEQIGVVYVRTDVVDADGKRLRRGSSAPKLESFKTMLPAFFRGGRDTFPCAVMFRTSDGLGAGGYLGQEFPLAADAAMWMMMVVRRGWAVFDDTVLAGYRIHANRATQTVRIRAWVAENTKLASFGIKLYEGEAGEGWAKLVWAAVHKLNAKVVYGLTLVEVTDGNLSPWGALRVLWEQRACWKGPVGMLYLFLALGKLFIPAPLYRGLRQIYRCVRSVARGT